MNNGNMRLFIACFIALIATSFGFIIRAVTMDTWAAEFGLSETQKGEIIGVGLWPFAISIVLFSLIIDKIGYGKAMLFAFVGHLASIAITIYAYKFRPTAGMVLLKPMRCGVTLTGRSTSPTSSSLWRTARSKL
ncbi:MAG: hypothetical protein QM703_17330 [Gemmatales bacterium]